MWISRSCISSALCIVRQSQALLLDSCVISLWLKKTWLPNHLGHICYFLFPVSARSLGSVALRKAERMAGRIHLNVFTVDFREELVALYGGSLQRQTLFLHESIKAILRLYKVRRLAGSINMAGLGKCCVLFLFLSLPFTFLEVLLSHLFWKSQCDSYGKIVG